MTTIGLWASPVGMYIQAIAFTALSYTANSKLSAGVAGASLGVAIVMTIVNIRDAKSG